MRNIQCRQQTRYAFLLIMIINLFALTSSFALTQPTQSTQPRYVSSVESILTSHQYIQQNPALMYWKISPFYLPQRNDTSCSLASTTMIINAARSDQKLVANEELATQDKVLARINNKEWAKEVAPDGNGVGLEQLKSFLPKALEAYGLHNFTVDAFHVNDTSKATADKLHDALLDMEKTGNTFIIANFDQNYFSGSMIAGHFSPIGAYDEKNKKVLIMDPDRALYEPYWAPEHLFLQSMDSKDNDTKQNRGYIVIKFNSSKTH